MVFYIFSARYQHRTSYIVVHKIYWVAVSSRGILHRFLFFFCAPTFFSNNFVENIKVKKKEQHRVTEAPVAKVATNIVLEDPSFGLFCTLLNNRIRAVIYSGSEGLLKAKLKRVFFRREFGEVDCRIILQFYTVYCIRLLELCKLQD